MTNEKLIFLKLNFKWLTIGIILIILGFMIMAWNNPGAVVYEEKVFSCHKLTLAPLILLAGYAIIGVAIMKEEKKEKSVE